jgi:hypothetical protein
VDVQGTTEKPKPRLGSWRLWVLFCACLAGAVLVRWLVLESAVSVSLRTMRVVSDSFVKRPAHAPEGELFPLWPMERSEEGGAAEPDAAEGPPVSPTPLAPDGKVAAPSPAKVSRLPRSRPLLLGPEPRDARADIATVLGFASRQLVPQGRTVKAEGELPGGIELYGVAPLGLGLVDGDRLVTVDGRPVSEQGQVVGAVLAARARRAPFMTAGLARRTAQGVRHFSVVVEQPYPEHIAEDGEAALSPVPSAQVEQGTPRAKTEGSPVRVP